MIDADTYLLELIRYIHLNPVRSNLSKSIDDYPWSVYNANLGNVKGDWLTTGSALKSFNQRKSEARKEYQRFE